MQGLIHTRRLVNWALQVFLAGTGTWFLPVFFFRLLNFTCFLILIPTVFGTFQMYQNRKQGHNREVLRRTSVEFMSDSPRFLKPMHWFKFVCENIKHAMLDLNSIYPSIQSNSIKPDESTRTRSVHKTSLAYPAPFNNLQIKVFLRWRWCLKFFCLRFITWVLIAHHPVQSGSKMLSFW